MSINSMYICNPMYLLHFKDILTNTTDSKQVHLNTHTAQTDRVPSRQYVSFNDTDVLYHVSSTTSLKWKHRTYKCSTVPCSVQKCISHLNCRRTFYFFIEVPQLIFLYRDDYIIRTFYWFSSLFPCISYKEVMSIMFTIIFCVTAALQPGRLLLSTDVFWDKRMKRKEQFWLK